MKAFGKLGMGLLAGMVMMSSEVVQADDFAYTVNSPDTNTITITEYSGHLAFLTIPNTINGLSVTSIGREAFKDCSMVGVTMGNNVTNIGASAFENCSSLTSFMGGKSVMSIGGSAFENCAILNNVTIGNNVISIGGSAFKNCPSLTSVMIPKSVTSIEGEAFWGCGSLTGVYFKGNAPSIDSAVFDFDDDATIYYLPGTTGWSTKFAGRPTAIWKP